MAPESVVDSQSLATSGAVWPRRRALQPANAVENTRRAEICGEFAGEAYGRSGTGIGGMSQCGDERGGEAQR